MKKNKLKILGLSNQDTGVYWYRIIQPLKYIAKQRLAEIHHVPFFGQHARHLTSGEFREFYELEGEWADVIFSTLASDREYLALLLAMKQLYNLKLVIDLDDDILSTHTEPNNPAYKAYMDPRSRFAEYAQACIREADLLIVSTEYLKRKYETLNSNIIVVKNCIDREIFKGKNKPDDVTIGFAGSGSHQGDWNMIEPILRELKKEHGVKVKVLGPVHTDIADDQINWVDMLKYPETLKEMGFSIGVAPLKDTLMARGKSNLRWLEYSSLKIPTVASSVVPFKGIKNIRYATESEDWKRELEALITDKNLRTSLGEAAYTEMTDEYDPRQSARILFDGISRLF